MNWLLSILTHLLGPSPTPQPPPIVVPPVPPVPVPVADGWQDQLLAATNAARASNGLGHLDLDPALAASSQAWATSMATAGVLAHGNFAARMAAVEPGRSAAENIAEGALDPSTVTALWMSDAGHRANLLGPYLFLGVGRAESSSGNLYWVTDFTD